MIRRVRLARNRNLTLATLLDDLLPFSGQRPVSYDPDFVGLDGVPMPEQTFQELYSEVCAMSRFLVEEAGLRPATAWPSTRPTICAASAGSWPWSARAASRCP